MKVCSRTGTYPQCLPNTYKKNLYIVLTILY